MRMRPSFVRVDDSNTFRRDNKTRRHARSVTALTLWLIVEREQPTKCRMRASGLVCEGASSRAANGLTSWSGPDLIVGRIEPWLSIALDPE